MPTISACPNCDKKLKTPDGAEGRKLRCPGCQAALVITEDGLAPAEGAVKARKGRAASRDDDYEDEAPRRSRRRSDDDEDDYEDEAPRRRSRKRSGGGIPMWVWLTGGGVLAAGLIILLLVLLLGGGNKFGKIKEGMTSKEVTDILGEPTTGDAKTIGVWYYPALKKDDMMNLEKVAKTKEIMTIGFKDGKVKDIKRIKADDIKKGLMK